MHIKEAHIGQLVTAEGYGGFAKILCIDAGYLENTYIATVKFGVNNSRTGRARSTDVYEFPLGKLTPTNTKTTKQEHPLEVFAHEQLLARLADIDAELQQIGANR
jgi:hypothetical protein